MGQQIMLSVLTIITLEVHRYNPSVSFADSSPYTSGALAVYRIDTAFLSTSSNKKRLDYQKW